MKPTKHATTNYKKLLPYIEGMGPDDDYRKFEAPAMMDLVIEYLHYTFAKDMPVFSIACYGEQNGDLMRDPDLCVAIHQGRGCVEPLSYQNDYIGVCQEVWITTDDGRQGYSRHLRADLDRFLWEWLNQIAAAGYTRKRATA